MGRRRWALSIVAVVLVAGLVAGALFWLLRGDEGDSSAPSARATATPAVALSPARAEEIASQMTAGDEASLRQAVVLPTGQPLDPTLLPGLASVQMSIDSGSYTPTGEHTATVEAQVTASDGTTSTWLLGLLLTDAGTWQVLDTVAQDNE